MKRLFIAAQWLAVIALAASLIAYFFRREPPPEHDPSSWTSWAGFHALAIEGVTDSRDPRYVTPGRLDEMLGALRSAGYKTITPDDVDAYYYKDRPLPEKAVMLIFEGGRKDHVIRATPRLVKHGYLGVLCVPTIVTTRWGNHFASRSDLRRIGRQANWRLASMGHRAIETIAVDGRGGSGHFLSRRLWSHQGLETEASFESRVTRDYEQAASILERAAGAPAAAYLYPYGDAAAGAEADPLAEMINRGAVRQFHRLAFSQEGRSYNNYFGDPYALSRLRVRGDWSGKQLVEYLEEWTPDAKPAGDIDSARWQVYGKRQSAGQSLVLGHRESALLRGSVAWSDVDLNAVVHTPTGSIGIIFLRFSGPQSYVRVTIQPEGIRAQEKRAGKLQSLAWLPLGGGEGNTRHELTLRLKNNRLWITRNGDNFARSVPLSRKTLYGHIRAEASGGEVQFDSIRIKPHAPLYVIDGQFHALTNELRGTATVLLPRWFSAVRPQPLSERQQTDVLRAAQEGIATIPVIQARDRLDSPSARALAAKIAEMLNYMTVKMLLPRFAIEGYQPEVHKTFAEYGLDIVYLVAPEEVESAIMKGASLSRAEYFIVEGGELEVLEVAERFTQVLPPQRLVVELAPSAPTPPGTSRAVRMIK